MDNAFKSANVDQIYKCLTNLMGSIPDNILDNIAYTYQHKQAILILDNSYIHPYGKDMHYLKLMHHDTDKLFMYALLKDKETASNMHKKYSVHHVENWPDRTIERVYETVLDYESARYTKPDKPLNAYATIQRGVNIGEINTEDLQSFKSVLTNLRLDSPENKDIQNVIWSEDDALGLLWTTIDEIQSMYIKYYNLYNQNLDTLLVEYNQSL